MTHTTSMQGKSDFTNRTKYLDILDGALAGRQSVTLDTPDAYRIIVLWGRGGQGKSELLWEFRHRIEQDRKAPGVISAVVDFEDPRNRDPLEAMLRLRCDLSRRNAISFDTFDAAFVALHKLENPGNSTADAYRSLERHGCKSQLIEYLETIASSFFGGSFLFKLIKDISPHISSWWHDDNVKSLVNEIDAERSASSLRERMPRYFGYDLRRAMMTDDSRRDTRVVMMFDHYHLLAYNTLSRTGPTDRWLRTLIKESPGTLVVIFGRTKLCWSDTDHFWQSALEHQKLDDFCEDDANRYLVAKGVEDPSIRARIVECAQGVPFHLYLCACQFQDIRASGREPGIDDFGTTCAEVVDKFIDHLPESVHSHLRLASYPETIDEPLFLDLVDAFPGHISNADWTQLLDQGFMQHTDSDALRLHPTMRTELQRRELNRRAAHFRRVHGWLFERYNKIAGEATTARDIHRVHDTALVAAARHLAQSDPARLPAWLLDEPDGNLRKFYEADRWQALAEVHEIAANAEPHRYTVTDRIWLDHHHAHVLQTLGYYKEARSLYQNARSNHEKALPDRHAERATIVHALADVCHRLGEAEESRMLYEEARKLYDREPGSFEQRRVDVHFSLGLIHDADGDHENAGCHYREAVELNRKIHGPESLLYARFLVQLGQACVTYGRTEEAETIFVEAYDILRKSDDDQPHKGYGPVLLELAECALLSGKAEDAQNKFTQAVAIFEQYAGSDHPNLGHALHRQARSWRTDSSRLADCIAQLQRAVDILRPTMGDQHTWTRQAAEDLESARAQLAAQPQEGRT